MCQGGGFGTRFLAMNKGVDSPWPEHLTTNKLQSSAAQSHLRLAAPLQRQEHQLQEAPCQGPPAQHRRGKAGLWRAGQELLASQLWEYLACALGSSKGLSMPSCLEKGMLWRTWHAWEDKQDNLLQRACYRQKCIIIIVCAPNAQAQSHAAARYGNMNCWHSDALCLSLLLQSCSVAQQQHSVWPHCPGGPLAQTLHTRHAPGACLYAVPQTPQHAVHVLMYKHHCLHMHHHAWPHQQTHPLEGCHKSAPPWPEACARRPAAWRSWRATGTPAPPSSAPNGIRVEYMYANTRLSTL